jgi:ABC-type amino acid transport substrate-binding protein
MFQRVIALLLQLLGTAAWATTVAAADLRVAVLENAPPMAFRAADGRLTGFTIEIARALCAEMKADCSFQPKTLNVALEELVAGGVDIAAISLLETPERRARFLFAKPYFRSVTLWFAHDGVQPGQPGVRVAVLGGSAQERFARARNWDTVAVRTNGELIEPLRAGVAQAALIPMGTGIGLMQDEQFRALGLARKVMQERELSGDVAFGISPRRPELKEPLDAALDRIKRNGTYDRINSQFLPLRVD